MHAYLLVGSEISSLKKQISHLAGKLGAKEMEFPLVKIGDVRNLNSLIRLTFDMPTLIICQNINEAGEEALNAFLKNLEEPQENIYFALTSPSVRKVLPTIASRCQIVKVEGRISPAADYREIEDFLKMSKGEQLKYINRFRDRGEAIEFVENMVFFMHRSLHENGIKYSVNPENIKLALKTLTGLNANGNVNLQLSNFIVNSD